RTGKDVNSHTVLDGIITTIMATIQRINIIGSREGSRYRRRLKANQTGKKFRVGIKSNISTNRNNLISGVDRCIHLIPHRHVYGEQWIKSMKDGVNATPLPTVNTTGYIDHAAFLATINPDTNKIPKNLFQGYLNIYNNYFKAPWMPDRTEANPNELNQDDARYGFRCCHLKNIWTAPLPPETELSRQMTTSTTSIDIMGLQAAYANLHTDQERDYF